MTEAFICDAVRTPIGRYGGSLAQIRADDLAALPLKALMDRNPGVNWAEADDLIFGCANQAGEDNRNVGRMALLLAGMPIDVSRTLTSAIACSRQHSASKVTSMPVQLVLSPWIVPSSRTPLPAKM